MSPKWIAGLLAGGWNAIHPAPLDFRRGTDRPVAFREEGRLPCLFLNSLGLDDQDVGDMALVIGANAGVEALLRNLGKHLVFRTSLPSLPTSF